MRLKICRSVFIGEDNILTKFCANPMHVVHVVHVHECARGQIWVYFCNLITETPLRPKICLIVVLDEDNLLTKFRANPMHFRALNLCTNVHACKFLQFDNGRSVEAENLYDSYP